MADWDEFIRKLERSYKAMSYHLTDRAVQTSIPNFIRNKDLTAC